MTGQLYEKAAVLYEGAADRHERSARELNERIWKDRANLLGSILLGAFGNMQNPYEARSRERQFAQIRALREAASRQPPSRPPAQL